MTLELLLPVAFLAGFFGSGHCLGMCGPIVLLLENPQTQVPVFQGMLRRVLYNAGRLFFYALLGAVAGAAGLVLTKVAGISSGLFMLRMLAALLVIALGLNLLFSLPLLNYLERSGALLWRHLSPFARHVLPISTPARALGAGFVWGALPCGLVYSAVAIAATNGSAIGGSLIMLAFWLGTLPALLLAGASANTLGKWTRHAALRRLTGLMLLCAGILALALPYFHSGTAGSHSAHSTVSTAQTVSSSVGTRSPYSGAIVCAPSGASAADGDPRIRPVITVIEPFTFNEVRAMSINGSIEISNATSAIGKPMAGNTTNAANVAPPPTPATPNELMATIPMSEIINAGSSGLMPILGAIIVANIAG
ncbi:MAG: sulfite exporter TauE/SafE family protein [Gammaproteobacteria bacterium]|nr:sulfite exporter TauE/SafE family protein [Gammaproteobacteria bacterium]